MHNDASHEIPDKEAGCLSRIRSIILQDGMKEDDIGRQLGMKFTFTYIEIVAVAESWSRVVTSHTQQVN